MNNCAPFLILKDYYLPKKWKAYKVGKYLTSLTSYLGLVPVFDSTHRHQVKAAWCSIPLCAYVRRRTVHNPMAASWHQDGDLEKGSKMDIALVLWTSNTPTELNVNGVIYTPPNRSVIIFRNLGCYHRRPKSTPRVRWLFRQLVEVPSHLSLP